MTRFIVLVAQLFVRPVGITVPEGTSPDEMRDLVRSGAGDDLGPPELSTSLPTDQWIVIPYEGSGFDTSLDEK
jgi:hypothetical protein